MKYAIQRTDGEWYQGNHQWGSILDRAMYDVKSLPKNVSSDTTLVVDYGKNGTIRTYVTVEDSVYLCTDLIEAYVMEVTPTRIGTGTGKGTKCK